MSPAALTGLGLAAATVAGPSGRASCLCRGARHGWVWVHPEQECGLGGAVVSAGALRVQPSVQQEQEQTHSMAEKPQIQLFIKASEDGESVGHCPFCQRLFMVLLLKGVPFTLTTVDVKRALDVLKDFAPGAQLPVLLYNGEPKTDTITIEEFLEDQLGPPMCPSLVPHYPESSLAGNDIFHKFSVFIKNPVPAQDEALQRSLLRALLKLDEYLSAPLEHELAQDPHLRASQRHFLDGDHLTLADCNLLPKLNIVQVVCQHYRRFGIPKDLQGVWRYLNSASETKEFKYTCPNSQEIIQAYRSVVRALQ
ncbi:chloride intracellular channel protein 3 isoform X1 [Poecile atricapillus]|uniref:chloride intracellular channel protein 3 isoform X1 n=1 Tax=Poecile atricapillus TaxID=48891 RepID=UPI00273840AE|nr:chloride intracellular channel protein 3 isoform X1 [Poecile atricapillus]